MSNFPENKNPENKNSEELPPSPQAFTLAAVVFEAFLAGIAVSIGYLLDFQVGQTFEPTWIGLGIGLAAAVPFILFFVGIIYIPIGPFRRMIRLVDELVVPRFRGCHITDLLAISIAAGIGEEMLFRGLIQGYLAELVGGSFGVGVGLVVASLFFALMHPMTPTYALIAGLISLCLGGIWILTGNLLVPVVMHTFYDFAVLVYLTRIRKPRGV